MSLWKKIGKGLKKILPYAAPVAASFIPGVGPALSGVIGKVGGALGSLGGSSARSQGSFASDPGGADMSEYSGVQTAGTTAQRAPFDWGSAIGGLAPLASGMLNYMGQRDTNVANAEQAKRQMDFQAQQTGSAYQRGTADMKAAGLNPMLAYSQGGAQSGGGAQATMGNELGAGANSALSAAATIQDIKLRGEQIEQTRAQTDLTDAQSRQSDAQTLNLAGQTKNLGADYITKEILNRYTEDLHRTSIRLGNSSARLNDLRVPQQEAIGKASDLVSRGLESVSSARDAASSALSDWTQPISDAEHALKQWAVEKRLKMRSKR